LGPCATLWIQTFGLQCSACRPRWSTAPAEGRAPEFLRTTSSAPPNASCYRSEHASLNDKRGSRGNSVLGSPYPTLQRKFDLTCPSGKNSWSQPKHGFPAAKNSSSTLALSKPD